MTVVHSADQVIGSITTEQAPPPVVAALFAIATYCGGKYGGWLTGNDRHKTSEAATRAALRHEACEAEAKATRMVRMVVAVSS